MTWQLIVSVGFLNGELRWIVSLLFSCVQACHHIKSERKENNSCEGKGLTQEAVFWKYSLFVFPTQALWEDLHTNSHNTPWTGHFAKPDICQKWATLKRRSFNGSSDCEAFSRRTAERKQIDHIEADICLFALDVWRQKLYLLISVAAERHAPRYRQWGIDVTAGS